MRVTLAGYVHLARMIDKCRAVLAGTEGEYIYPCPLDERLLEFVGITCDQFTSAVRTHPTDAGVAAWFQFQAFTPLLGVAGVFAVGQLLEGMVLTPLLVGDRIGLHPVAVIFAIMAGGQLAGFAGVLLALPVAAVIMVLVRHAHRSYKGSAFYSQQHQPD